ncbi:MAG: hypothetical protein BYD32DRAFT_402418 [Podila humilis]|nr:MAG: hypothetical protein BYD32DRAFT_402418 [Podila humilis]
MGRTHTHTLSLSLLFIVAERTYNNIARTAKHFQMTMLPLIFVTLNARFGHLSYIPESLARKTLTTLPLSPGQ